MPETEDLEQTIEFYTRNLGFECRGVYLEENPGWASRWNDTCEIAFGLANADTNFESSKLTGSIYLVVENFEEIWQKLKDTVEIVYPLEDMIYGMREFGIRDPNGYILNLGQNIE